MRKLYLSLLIILSAIGQLAFGQCVPDSTVTGLYSPSAQEGLPNGQIGALYESVIYFNIPAETTIVVTANIDSVAFTDISGLPEGIEYQCNPEGCVFPGGSYACILLTGTPNNTNDVGDNDLEVSFTLYTNITDVSDKIEDYSIFINEGTPTGVADKTLSEMRLEVDQNPAGQQSNLMVDLPETAIYSIEVYSLLGAKVYTTAKTGVKGLNKVSVGSFGLEGGMYFVTVRQGSYSNSTRFILK